MALPERQLRELALFAGAGGGILGGHLLGWRCVCAVEFAAYPRSVLLARQRDGMLPRFPVWDDVRTFSGKPWRGSVDIVTGGFPCQDISVAGKGDGLDGERSGLWSEMARIISEVQPRFAFVENSPMLTSRGLDRVLGDLSEMGYSAEYGVVGADDAGAPHRRERIWILAYSNANSAIRRGQDEMLGHGYDAQRICSASPSGQHPIRQMAYPDLCGRLHGQAQERTAEGGFDAQREPIPSGPDVADASEVGLSAKEEVGELGGFGLGIDGNRGGGGGREYPAAKWWSTEPGLGGVVDELACAMVFTKQIAG